MTGRGHDSEPEAHSPGESDDLLESLRRTRVRPEIPVMPQTPTSRIEAIQDPQTRQRARDAWDTAHRLSTTLWLWGVFLAFQEMGSSLDDAQAEFRDRFPDFQGLGRVLETIAHWKSHRRGPAEDLASMNEVIGLISKFHDEIRDSIHLLNLIGIRVGPQGDGIEGWRELASGIFLHEAHAGPAPRIAFAAEALPKTTSLQNSVAEFLRYFSLAPETVLNSRETRPIPRWDRDARQLWFGAIRCKEFRRQPASNQVAILDAF